MATNASFAQRLAAARRGDPWACQWIWDTYAGRINGFLQARGTPEVEDVLNDVFLGVFTGLERFSGTEPMFRAWIYRVARNKRVDALRRSVRRPAATSMTVDAMGGDVEDEAVAALEDADLRALLSGLTPAQRDVIVLRFVADLSIEQVASVLETAPGAIKALQHRAVAQLRKKISADPYPRTTVPTM